MRNSWLAVACVTLLAMVALTVPGAAAEPPASGSIGLMASLQSDQIDILVPWWWNSKVSFAPMVRFVSIGDSYTDFGIGASLRVYRRSATVSPYVGVRGMALTISPKTGDSWTDYVFGGAFGGDYFVDEHLSLGVEAQINASKSADQSTRFGNPGGTNINSGMGVFAAVYF